MSVRPKINLYLIHQETGQRYPVGEEVIVGRSSGDLLFNDDIKMSSQHCRILRTPQGLGIHDLGSSNGTYVDGIRLNPEKIYMFKPNSLLTAGQQAFKLQETTMPRKPGRRRSRKKKAKSSGWDLWGTLAVVLVIGSALYFAHLYLIGKTNKKADEKIASLQKILSPFAIVENEMKSAFAEYADLGKSHASGELSDKGLANAIRKNLVPRLTAVYEKLGVLKPTVEYEKRKVEVNRKLVKALLDQVAAMASFADTKDPKFSKEIERLSALASSLSEEARQLDNSRKPTHYSY